MKKIFQQTLPILLTILTFLLLCILLYGFINLLNILPIKTKIIPRLFIADILVGLTIYLKTSVDFALFIGRLMGKHPGWKNRIAIEIGTALGNGFGTFFVLSLWTFFKEVPLLLVVMILLAALVLFAMAQEGLEELFVYQKKLPKPIAAAATYSYQILRSVNTLFSPLTRHILPKAPTEGKTVTTFLSLILFAFTIPLILGLDDFAGYIPLFSIINVFGFASGAFLGHMLLNIALFASPSKTEKFVKLPIILFLGSAAFIGIGLWGFVEVGKIILQLVH